MVCAAFLVVNASFVTGRQKILTVNVGTSIKTGLSARTSSLTWTARLVSFFRTNIYTLTNLLLLDIYG